MTIQHAHLAARFCMGGGVQAQMCIQCCQTTGAKLLPISWAVCTGSCEAGSLLHQRTWNNITGTLVFRQLVVFGQVLSMAPSVGIYLGWRLRF